MKLKFLISLFIVVIFLCSNVYAIGIIPAKIEVNFIAGEKHEFNFQPIISNDADLIDITVEGDLVEYVTVNKNIVAPGESVIVTLQFPDKIDKPGNYRIYIAAAERIASSGVIGARAQVRGVISVFVPYEGKYIEPLLNIPNANVDEKINVMLNLKNKGTLNALVTSQVKFFDSLGNEMITFSFGVEEVKSFGEKTLSYELDTKGWRPARYYAETDIAYDGPKIDANATFNIGSLFVNVTNYTKEMVKESIQKYYINIKNGWNGNLGEVFADVNVSNNMGGLIFRTPSVSLRAWSEVILEGFLDTSNLELGSHDVEIVLYYQGEKTIVQGKLDVVKKSSYLIWIVLGIVLIMLVVGFILWRKKLNVGKVADKK